MRFSSGAGVRGPGIFGFGPLGVDGPFIKSVVKKPFGFAPGVRGPGT